MKIKFPISSIANYKKSVEIYPGNTWGIEMLQELGVDTESLTKEVIVEDAILESYVGTYELYQEAPDKEITVSKYGSQLKTQATGQNEVPIFPKSQNVFYMKLVEALLTFNTNDAGEVESIFIQQGGYDITGKKLAEQVRLDRLFQQIHNDQDSWKFEFYKK